MKQSDQIFDITDVNKALVGLGSVDDKSSATLLAEAKVGVVAADIGLDLVDNTSDADKPVSIAQATAIGLKEDITANDEKLALKANINGDNTKIFKVADAINADEAINKGQLDANSVSGALSTDNFMHIQDQKPDGTEGGSSVAGVQTRELNTILTNNITGASLSSNVITLQPGTYYIEAKAPVYKGDRHKAFIRDVTNSTDILIGLSSYSNSGNAVVTHSFIGGLISLPSTTDIVVNHDIQVATATTGLGLASAEVDGNVEVYTDLKIWKVG